MEKKVIEACVLLLPALVLFLHRSFPENQFISCLIPRLLPDGKHPKAGLRKAGAGCLVFGLWLLSVVIVTAFLFPKLPLVRYPVLLALFCFVFPLSSAVALFIGTSYLLAGLFGREENIKPRLESMFYVQPGELENYVKKLRIYTLINISCPVILAVLLPIEYMLGTGTSGPLVLVNVSFLIAFIMTTWRMRNYLVKAAMLMDLPAREYLSATLFRPAGIFSLYWHAFSLLKKHKPSSTPAP